MMAIETRVVFLCEVKFAIIMIKLIIIERD